MIEIVPFKPEHAKRIQSREASRLGIASAPTIGRGPGFTGLDNGEPFAAAGLSFDWPGVATAWAIISKALTFSQAKFVQRSISRIFPDLVEKHGLHRVQCIVMADDEVACRWAESFGFHYEALLTKYTARKEDVVIYVRV